MIMYKDSPSNFSSTRVRNSPSSRKLPCYGSKIPLGFLTSFGFTWAPRWAPDVGDFWRLRVKWHKTRHTYKRQTHSGQRENNNCTSKQARGLFLYSPPGQNSRLYDQTCSVQHMCINVIVQQKGVKFWPAAESVQSPYHKKGMFPYLQGTINLKVVSIFLAEHLVCKQHISTSLLWLH